MNAHFRQPFQCVRCKEDFAFTPTCPPGCAATPQQHLVRIIYMAQTIGCDFALQGPSDDPTVRAFLCSDCVRARNRQVRN